MINWLRDEKWKVCCRNSWRYNILFFSQSHLNLMIKKCLTHNSRNSRWALLWKTDRWISAWFRHISLGSCHGASSLCWPQVFVRGARGEQARHLFSMLSIWSYFNRPVDMDTWMVVQQNVDAFTLRFCVRLKLFIWSKNAQTSILLSKLREKALS